MVSHTIKVPPLAKPQRLDLFLLRHFPQTSRQFWKDHLEKIVRVQGAKTAKGSLLKGGEIILLKETPSPQFVPLPNPDLPLKIIFEDEYLIAVDKTAGLPCHPLQAQERETVANGLIARFPELGQFSEKSREAGLLHRLDNETSGVLLFARNPPALAEFRDLQNQGKIAKFYLAWVSGCLEGRGCWEDSLGHRGRKSPKMGIASAKIRGVRSARTFYRSIRSFPELSLLFLKIHRGARHQIRAQLANVGHPVLGDRIYGTPMGSGTSRHLLHARSVYLKHPFTGKWVWIKSPMPEDFRQLLP